MPKIARCYNCRRLRHIRAEGRCKTCYLYLLRTGQERPCPTKDREHLPPMCDCGRARVSRALVVPNGRVGHRVRIRVCEMCWELEKG